MFGALSLPTHTQKGNRVSLQGCHGMPHRAQRSSGMSYPQTRGVDIPRRQCPIAIQVSTLMPDRNPGLHTAAKRRLAHRIVSVHRSPRPAACRQMDVAVRTSNPPNLRIPSWPSLLIYSIAPRIPPGQTLDHGRFKTGLWNSAAGVE